MLLCLFEPDIPQNTGSMIRLAACMNVPLHIIEPCGFPFDEKRLRRVALDYYELAAIVRHMSWQKFLSFVQERQSRIVLLTTRATQFHYEFQFQKNDILLLGRESSGATDEVRAAAQGAVKIPLNPKARSLNVTLAASMVLGEALRQTGQFPS